MLELTTPNYESLDETTGQIFAQNMHTVPGVNYSVAFDLHIGGFGSNFLNIYINNENPFLQYSHNFTGWIHVTSSFVAQTTSDVFNIEFLTTTGKGLWDFDNIVVLPMTKG
jgi:hypothetical protein